MNRGKNLLFLTNFSEACFQAIPAVAEWTDREEGHLTLLHVHPTGRGEDNARKSMRSFFAEADRYAKWERTLLSGDAMETLVGYCRQTRPDIVFAPASHPVGFPRFRHRSVRAALLREGGVKIWTRGRNGQSASSRRAPENVAYVISGHADWAREALVAAETALRHRARLHLINLVPPQEIHDGTLAGDIRVSHPNVPADEFARVVNSLPLSPVIHSSAGDEFRELPRLLRQAGANAVFAGERHVLKQRLLRVGFNRDLERLDCDVFCFPSSAPDLKTETVPQKSRQKFSLLPNHIR